MSFFHFCFCSRAINPIAYTLNYPPKMVCNLPCNSRSPSPVSISKSPNFIPSILYIFCVERARGTFDGKVEWLLPWKFVRFEMALYGIRLTIIISPFAVLANCDLNDDVTDQMCVMHIRFRFAWLPTAATINCCVYDEAHAKQQQQGAAAANNNHTEN